MPRRRGGARSRRAAGLAVTGRRERVFEVGHTERDVARLVLQRQPGHLRGDGIRRVALQERQQVEERSLAQHREQEHRQRQVGLVEQRLQRCPATGARLTPRGPPEGGAAGEHLDVPGLVGDLHGEQLHDLAEVRVDASDEPGRHRQRGQLVLDQVRHHLDDRRLDVGVELERRRPVHRRRRIPLRRQRLGIELRREVGPHDVALDQVGGQRRPARLHQRAPRREPPRR